MRYLVFLALLLTGCTTRYDAQVAQANAQSAQAQAAIIQAQEQARMFQQLAESSKPVYWPIVVTVLALVVVFGAIILLFMRWHMITISHVAAGQPMQADQLRLLPGQPGFNRQLRLAARERGMQAVRSNGAYYLVDADGQRTPVRQLTVRQ